MHAFQRPDASHVEVDESATTLSGHAGSFAFGKIAGEKTRFNSYLGYKTPGFDINDLGFQRRADERNVGNWFQMRDNVPRPLHAIVHLEPESVGGLELRRRPPVSAAATSTCTGRGRTIPSQRLRPQPERGRRSATASPAAGRPCSATRT